MSEWQPIETAPADVPLLLCWADGEKWLFDVGEARNTRGGWSDGDATHWMPLPAPPATSTAQQTAEGK
jgi:Protein of unknown function (DUF551)